jgi:hypothetical protein
VFELQERVPGVRIGTVDNFQGREAPIVTYSMTTSSHLVAPRRMEFLCSANRLNVATSRAKCISVVVASPCLFEAECRMQLANAFCRYLELASARRSDHHDGFRIRVLIGGCNLSASVARLSISASGLAASVESRVQNGRARQSLSGSSVAYNHIRSITAIEKLLSSAEARGRVNGVNAAQRKRLRRQYVQ